MTRLPTRRAVSAVLGALLLGALGACGIPADDEPRAVSEDQVPQSTTTSVGSRDDQTRSVELYFVRFDGQRDVLAAVDHEVPTGGESGMPTPATVLDALLSGVPAEADVDPSVVTKIPADTALASQPELRSGTLTVDLDGGISGVQGDGSRLAYGQMVCTVDALEGVDRVVFEVEGEPVRPLDGEGITSSAPLTCASYENLLGEPTGAPETP